MRNRRRRDKEGSSEKYSLLLVTVMPASPVMGSWWKQLLGPGHPAFTSHFFHKRVAATLISRGNFWHLGTLLGRLGRRSLDVFKSWCATGTDL